MKRPLLFLKRFCLALLLLANANGNSLARERTFFDIDRALVISAEDHLDLAENAPPLSGAVALTALRDDPAGALNEALERICGRARPQEAQRSLEQRVRMLNTNLLSAVRRVQPDEPNNFAAAIVLGSGAPLRIDESEYWVGIQVPFCVGSGEDIVVVAQPGDSIDSLIRHHLPGTPPRNLYEELYAANAQLLDARRARVSVCRHITEPAAIVRCLNGQIRAGDRIVLPRAPRHRSVENSPQTQENLARLAPEGNPQRSVTSVIRLVDAADAALTETPDCAPAGAPGSFPIQGEDIWRRYTHQRALARQATRSVVVGLVDAGVRGPRAPQFPEAFFAGRAGDVPDKWGNSIEDRGEIAPYAGGAMGNHGTQVADILTGGQAFRNAVSQAGGEAPLRLRVFSLSNTEDTMLHRPTAVLWGIGYLLDKRVGYETVSPALVNLSLEQGEGETSWRRVLRHEYPQILFIAAAGNGRDDEPAGPRYLQNPDDRVYPASLGGVEHPNILIVAALDRNGRLASFSNFGPDVVEIAAPGCALDLLGQDYTTTLASGTSFSAPQVTFAAALIASLSPPSPPDRIKQRLIYSADFTPSLAHDVRLGAVLNIPRAVAVHSDVLSQQSGGVQTGILIRNDALADVCPADRQAGLRRIIATRTGANRFLVERVFIDIRGAVTLRPCANAPIAANALMFLSDGASQATDLSGLSFFDLTFRDPELSPR